MNARDAYLAALFAIWETKRAGGWADRRKDWPPEAQARVERLELLVERLERILNGRD